MCIQATNGLRAQGTRATGRRNQARSGRGIYICTLYIYKYMYIERYIYRYIDKNRYIDIGIGIDIDRQIDRLIDR